MDSLQDLLHRKASKLLLIRKSYITLAQEAIEKILPKQLHLNQIDGTGKLILLASSAGAATLAQFAKAQLIEACDNACEQEITNLRITIVG